MDKLNKGDLISVIAPSGYVDPTKLESGINVLESWGLKVVRGKYLNKKSGYFSASDEERLFDIHEAFNNPEIKAVFCARGGYGLSRIIDKIDFSQISQNPKLVIGFSDISLLHFALNKNNVPSIHGCMVAQFSNPDYKKSVELLKNLLFDGKASYALPANDTFPRKGSLIGGNLRMIVDSLATEFEPETHGKVLFIEDIGEGLYKIDRMLQHLRRAGKLNGIQGIVLGHFTSLSDSTPPFEKDLKTMVLEAIPSDIPIILNFPAGHEYPNFPIVLGGQYTIEHNEIANKISFEL